MTSGKPFTFPVSVGPFCKRRMDDSCMKLSFRGLLKGLLKEHLCLLDKTKMLFCTHQDSTLSPRIWGEKKPSLKAAQSIIWPVIVSEKSILGPKLLASSLITAQPQSRKAGGTLYCTLNCTEGIGRIAITIVSGVYGQWMKGKDCLAV